MIALVLSLMAFWIDYSDRIEERTVRAWQLLTTRATGNSGKRRALEYLHSQGTSLIGIDLSPLEASDPSSADTPTEADDGEVSLTSPLETGSVGAFLVSLQLPGATLTRANLERAVLTKANLIGANLEGAILKNAILVEADLERAELGPGASAGTIGVELPFLVRRYVRSSLRAYQEIARSNLEGAILYRANLKNADLYRANLRHALLIGADLSGANLKETNVAQHQLDWADGDATTKIPEGRSRPAHWLK